MKRIKKILSVMLAMAMVFAMPIAAFAEGETTATRTYEIFQIFTGQFHEGILSNVKWGASGTGEVGQDVDNAILEELEAVSDNGDTSLKKDTAQLAVIQKYADLSKPYSPGSEPTTVGNTTTYTNVPSGYYLVRDQDGTQDGEGQAYSLYVVQVVDNTLTIVPKVDVPTSDKKIVEGNDRVDVNEAGIGDTVTYEITGTLPANFDAFKTYYYVFNDTLSKGLDFDASSVKVEVSNNGIKKDVTDRFYVNGNKATDGKTNIVIGIQDIKTLSMNTANGTPAPIEEADLTKDTVIVVTYNAVLNTDAVIAGAGNPNDVVLNYSNDPNNSGDGPTTPPDTPEEPTPGDAVGVTPKKEVVTFTTELAILKTDEAGNILEGAEFTLTGNGVKVSLVTEEEFVPNEKGAYYKLKNGSYTTIAPVEDETADGYNADKYDLAAGKFDLVRTITHNTDEPTEVKATIDADGRITFTGLGVGEYTLSETKTPAGYNTYKDVTFNVIFDPAKKEFSADNGINLGSNNTLESTIVNRKGSTLPSTGGIGTTIFYIIGGILVVGAAILLVTKKRVSKEA